MSNLSFSGEYKDKIIKLLIKNEALVKLINPAPHPDLDVSEVLMGGEWTINGKQVKEQGHIFDYNFVNDTITETKAFIFVETDNPAVVNNIFTEFNLYICVFAHKDIIKLNSSTTPKRSTMKKMGYIGNRIDCLCDAVDRTINGRSDFGIGDVSPAPRGYVSIYAPNSDFYGKVLKYTVRNYNSGGDACEVN